MYPASAAFHRAVYERNPKERVLITMPELCLNAEDLVSSLTYTDPFNNAEELVIGECPAATLEFKILNDHGLLSDYSFTGECNAMIGVRTEEAKGAGNMPYAILRYGLDNPVTFEGHLSEPYLTVNGIAPIIQPPFPVHAIVIDGSRIYCVSEDGKIWGAAWVDGRVWNALAALTWGEISAEQWASLFGYLVPLEDAYDWNALAEKIWNELDDKVTVWDSFFPELSVIPFMRMKLAKWAAQKRGIWRNGLESYEFGEAIEKYEYVPLGKFLPDQPKKKRVTQIAFTSNDRMLLFDRVATAFLEGLKYPVTIGEVLAQLCAYVGVTLSTPTFINSTRTLSKALFAGEDVTCREVLQWIAEAACSYGCISRDGELKLEWFGTEAVAIPMEQYFDIDIAEYEVAPIDKLQILGSETDIGVIIGDGVNGYQIMDNPYLYGASDAEIRPLGVPIYNRLAAFAAFRPINARAVCNWAIERGDIIAITLNGVIHSLPLYRQVITWNGGGARVTYESTGSASRPVMTAANRRVFNQKRAIHEITVNVDGLKSRIENAEGDITSLNLTAQGLTTRVSNTENGVANLTLRADQFEVDLENTEQSLSSQISQTVNSIKLGVENGAESSTFTLTAGSATLSTGTIKFSGMVTFSGLANGTTTIDGACIKTGTVDADRIDVNNLYVKHLNGADGTFTGTLQAATGTFETLDAVGGLIHFGGDYIEVNGIEIGYVPGYSQVSIIPPSANTGNVGSNSYPWNNIVATYIWVNGVSIGPKLAELENRIEALE